MNILAFDTCFDACSVAVRSQAGRLAHRHARMRMGHAEALVPFIAEVLVEAGLTATDIDRIAVTRGPGTFTGTRIGVAAARALALATGADVVGFSSFHAIAQAIRRASEVNGGLLIVRPSRRGSHDGQAFSADGRPLVEPLAGTPAEFAAHIEGLARRHPSHPVHVFGSGSGELAQAWATSKPDLRWVLEEAANERISSEPDACDLLDLAASVIIDAENPVAPVTPLYLRPADAKPSSKPAIARA